MSPNRVRHTIKGFNWLASHSPQAKLVGFEEKGLKNFRIQDEKKKWKIKNCENFKGYAERMEQLLKHKRGVC